MDTQPKVFVTGATGQDGSYLCERLIAEGADVHGLVRTDTELTSSLPWQHDVTWHAGDLGDAERVQKIIAELAPDEVYNLGGISSVAHSWDEPVATAQITGAGAAAIFDAARQVQDRLGRPVRVVQASSAEIFGSPATSPQDESAPVQPVTPYGAAKAFAHHLAGTYRSRGVGVSSLILYNHESPRRPTTFVTRKITRGVAAIALGLESELALGNLDVIRDWGWAPDVVDAMVRANRADEAADYVIATGEARTVRDFVEAAFTAAEVTDWQSRVRVDPAFFRPADPGALVGNSAKARRELGWRPTKGFSEIVTAMVEQDLHELSAIEPTPDVTLTHESPTLNRR